MNLRLHSYQELCRRFGCILAGLAWLCAASGAWADTTVDGSSWTNQLARMPLVIDQTQTIRLADCVPLLMKSFTSNQVMRALIVMPMASDHLYFFRDKHLRLETSHAAGEPQEPQLLSLIQSMTNSTPLSCIFRNPYLLICGPKDRLSDSLLELRDQSAERWLDQRMRLTAVWIDRSWDFLEPLLRAKLECSIVPGASAESSWHFYRANMAGYGLTARELLTSLSLTTKTRVIVTKGRLAFSLDR